jgi:hypothetical protein
LDRLPKKNRIVSTNTDHDALHHHADDHDEHRAGKDGDNERARIGIGQPAGVAAEHEHGAVSEIEHAEGAVNDGESGGDQRQQRSEHEAVEALRNEIGPVDHAAIRRFCVAKFCIAKFCITLTP